MKYLSKIVVAAFFSLGVFVQAEETYEIDAAHASIGFSVSHLVISNVKGNFDKFTGSIQLDEKGEILTAEATIDASSIDTDNKKRDDHLRSPDFFEVKKFPEIIFSSKKSMRRAGKMILLAQITIHGVSKNIELPYTIKGPITDPWGNKKIGFEASTTINRTDFGLNWNKALETGGVVVGEEVELLIDFEAAKKK